MAQQVGEALRTSKRGSAAGLSGTTVELYKLLLGDATALESFTFAVNVAARPTGSARYHRPVAPHRPPQTYRTCPRHRDRGRVFDASSPERW